MGVLLLTQYMMVKVLNRQDRVRFYRPYVMLCTPNNTKQCYYLNL